MSARNLVRRRKFKEINEAYSVLSDDQKKAQYNNMGHETFTNASKGSYFPEQGGRVMADSILISPALATSSISLAAGVSGALVPRPGANLLMRIQIRLEDAVAGIDREIEVMHSEPCAACSGSGSETKRLNVCPRCGGSGQMRQATSSPFGQLCQDDYLYTVRR